MRLHPGSRVSPITKRFSFPQTYPDYCFLFLHRCLNRPQSPDAAFQQWALRQRPISYWKSGYVPHPLHVVLKFESRWHPPKRNVPIKFSVHRAVPIFLNFQLDACQSGVNFPVHQTGFRCCGYENRFDTHDTAFQCVLMLNSRHKTGAPSRPRPEFAHWPVDASA